MKTSKNELIDWLIRQKTEAKRLVVTLRIESLNFKTPNTFSSLVTRTEKDIEMIESLIEIIKE